LSDSRWPCRAPRRSCSGYPAYFAWLAFRIATAPPLTEPRTKERQPSFAGGIFLSLVNPKGYAAMAALFSSFVLIRDRAGFDVIAKIMVLAVIIAAVNIFWLCMGAALTRLFKDPRSNRIINMTFAALLVVSVIGALLL
jgi:threonine/homoserine/homoserine lactone efflux protein